LKSGSLNLLEPLGPVQAYKGITLSLPIKFISDKQAKEKYRNIKGKLYKKNAAKWYKKICRETRKNNLR
jgi:hypothetical protein